MIAKYSADLYIVKISESKRFAKELQQASTAEEVWIKDETIYVRTKDYRNLNRDILKLALQLDINLQAIEPVHSKLEDIFRTALRR